MGTDKAIARLRTSNKGIDEILATVHDQMADIRSDERLANVSDDIEKLFESYLITWKKSNNEIIEILQEDD